MSKKDEALKLALEALEEACEIVGAAWAWRDEKGRPAITAIRVALASKSEALASGENEQPAYRAVKTFHEGKPVYVAEQPAQEEPSVHAISGRTADELWLETGRLRSELADLKAQQQEPVAYMNPDDLEKMKRFGRGSVAWATPTDFCTQPVYTSPPAQRKPLTDEQINLFINGRGEEGDDDYVEPTGDGFGLTDADLVQLVRRVEAAHGIKE